MFINLNQITDEREFKPNHRTYFMFRFLSNSLEKNNTIQMTYAFITIGPTIELVVDWIIGVDKIQLQFYILK